MRSTIILANLEPFAAYVSPQRYRPKHKRIWRGTEDRPRHRLS
jgi:hypothetical protein